jgi:hypothetical protein
MKTYDEPDFDLERRLRRIAEAPEPAVPGSVFRHAAEVTARQRGFQVLRSSRSGPRRSLLVGFASVAAVLVLAAGFTLVLRNPNNVAGSPTPSGSAPASPSSSASPEETASPAPKSGDFEDKSMTRPRDLHTATLLADGRVLIAGGDEGGNTSELYDPTGGTFAATGSMRQPREGHTATLLPDGRILIAGGDLVADPAELYDAETGSFTETGSMNTPRGWHTATLLPNGLVLIAGGDGSVPGGVGSIAAAELYDPQTGKFSRTGSMTTPRDGHTATLLPNGLVLIAGGGSLDATLASAELYNPQTGKFSRTGSMTTARYGHTATLLPNGLVLIAGGDAPGSTVGPVQTAELYDPKTGEFRATGSMVEARSGHTATLLPNGSVLMAGGNSVPVGAGAGVEKYDPSSGTFAPVIAGFYATVGQTATLLPDGRVLFAGGKLDDTVLSAAWLFAP